MERLNSRLKSENRELKLENQQRTKENEMLKKTLRNLEQENQALIDGYNERRRQLYQAAANAVVNNPRAASNQAPSSTPDLNQPSTSSNSNSS